jgi:phosphomannomutase
VWFNGERHGETMLGRVFKAYDIRGTYPDLLTDFMGWQIGCGVAKYLLEDAAAAGETTPMMKNILVGRDMRTSSPKLSEELIRGITTCGGSVIDLGMIDTSMMYFAINHLDCAGGVVVTASHNPPQYNGFKVSKRKAKPVGETTGWPMCASTPRWWTRARSRWAGRRSSSATCGSPYKKHVLSFLDLGEQTRRTRCGS